MTAFGMDFDRSIDCSLRYDPHENQHDGHRWSVGSSADFPVYTTNIASRSPSFSTMNRYLHETDAPFSTPATTFVLDRDFANIDPLGHVLPSNVRLSSPAYTSNVSSSWGDQRDISPLASPEVHALPLSPFQSHMDDMVPFAFGGNPPIERRDSYFGGCCVAMHDVQKTADEQPDNYTFDDEPEPYVSYGSYVQEGYQSIGVEDTNSNASHSGASSETSYNYPPPMPQRHDMSSPVIRRRRPQSSRNGHSPAASTRISKRPQVARRSSSYQSGARPSEENYTPGSAGRAFPCPMAIYGCTSSFGSKNEWKRHVTTQHMRLGFWRCDLCTNERKPNDFNRKDLFTQHVRRMHPADGGSRSPVKRTTTQRSATAKEHVDEQYLQDAARRCYHALRLPPQECSCIFCPDKSFRGSGAWEERMEHVGRHMENAKKDGEDPVDLHEWITDEMVQQWMISQQLLVVHGQQLVLAQ